MTEALTKLDGGVVEQVLLGGDLSKATPQQRVAHYLALCESLHLNPLSKPFDYIVLNGKLTLYTRKDATEQLRKRDGVSIVSVVPQQIGETYVVTVSVRDEKGRTDAATGAVCITGLKGEALANAMMKAETKAKRRATLSLCGLGMPDESEIDSIPDARPAVVDVHTGEIALPPAPTVSSDPPGTPITASVGREPAPIPTPRPGEGLRVTGVQAKEGETKGKPWVLYLIRFSDGREGASFDAKVAELAEKCRDASAPVEVTMEPHPKNPGKWKLIELRQITQPADGEDVLIF